ncbi:MAG: hypothetical protein IKB86_01475 [Clostridia bacterium]|nr:hypothetical protein [Clostridia bacterium]
MKKIKNLIPIIFTTIYAILLALDVNFNVSLFGNLQYAVNSLVVYLLPLICPVLVLIFLLCENKEFALKKWLLPVALGVNIASINLTLASWPLLVYSYYDPMQLEIVLWSLRILLITTLLTFVGALFYSKNIFLLRYGALASSITNLVIFVLSFHYHPIFFTFAYMDSNYGSRNIILTQALMVALALFYLGIFVYTFNFKRNNLSNKNKGE